jgi:putative two-component system response regulator
MNTRASILIVDDDAEIRTFLADLVLSVGATPLEAADGQAALQAVRAVLPDLILLDVEMPRMDGFTACRRLKSDPATARIPIVVITSLSALDDRIQGIEAGADDFLTKPINVPEFKARARSLLRVKKLNDSLESAENVIFALANAIESKDKYTQGHTERVTAYAVELGRVVGCSENEILALRQGGTLHDIGKIGVPDHILNKPGKLTHEEFQIIRQHPIVGYNICAPMKSLAHTLPCIRWHHEKPNGQGYPDGLRGSEIPRLALILSVTDVYDALTSKRSYKDAMSQEDAFAILYEEANKGGLEVDLVMTFTETVIPSFHLKGYKTELNQ